MQPQTDIFGSACRFISKSTVRFVSCAGLIWFLVKELLLHYIPVPLYCLRCEYIEVVALKQHHNANAGRPHDFVSQ